MANISSIGGNPIVPAAVQSDTITDAMLVQTGGVLDKLDFIGVEPMNMFDKSTITSGMYIAASGNLNPSENFFASDFIDVAGMSTIRTSYNHLTHFYTADKTHILMVDGNSVVTDMTVTVPENAAYLRFSTYNQYLDTAQVGPRVSRGNYVPYGKYRLPNLVPENDGVGQEVDLLNIVSGGNLYNSYNLVYGYYINPETGLVTSTIYDGFAYSPTYIKVTPGESLCSNYRPFIAYYDSNLDLLSGMQMDTSKTTVVPAGASYARFSFNAPDHTAMVVMRGTTVDTSVGRYSFSLGGLKVDVADVTNNAIIVDASGGGDYTSFTEAVYETVDSKKDIIVKPGTYDIEAEYVALFGQDVVDNLADSTTGINDFQYGIRVHDRTITFEAGAHLVCDWTGRTVDGTHRFCAFRIEPNAKLIGLDLDCAHTFYAIHDDYGTPDQSPFTIRYENCRIIGHDLVNANCIGGGCHKYSRHIIRNCYFDNNRQGSGESIVGKAAVRYHNTSGADAEPEVYVSDCYFSTNINFSYYGSQTTKMRAYVNNCYAPNGINKVAESSSSTVDNVEIYKWNNVESA